MVVHTEKRGEGRRREEERGGERRRREEKGRSRKEGATATDEKKRVATEKTPAEQEAEEAAATKEAREAAERRCALALCFVLCALCFVLCALCFVLCALCFVLCTQKKCFCESVDARWVLRSKLFVERSGKFLLGAQTHPNKKIKLIGARTRTMAQPQQQNPVQGKWHQKRGGFCALNCLLNACKLADVDIPESVSRKIKAKGPFCTLEFIATSLRSTQCCVRFRTVKWIDNTDNIRNWLLDQSSGVFVVELMNQGHCIVCSCVNSGCVIESDPSFPVAMQLNYETFEAVGLTRATKIYKLHPIIKRTR